MITRPILLCRLASTEYTLKILDSLSHTLVFVVSDHIKHKNIEFDINLLLLLRTLLTGFVQLQCVLDIIAFVFKFYALFSHSLAA